MVENVAELKTGTGVGVSFEVKACRIHYGLSVLQAAKALGVSPTTYERMEQGYRAAPSQGFAERAFASASQKGIPGNLLFGSIPLRAGRELLSLSRSQMAALIGCAPDTYKKMELDAREISQDVRDKMEGLVREKVDSFC